MANFSSSSLFTSYTQSPPINNNVTLFPGFKKGTIPTITIPSQFYKPLHFSLKTTTPNPFHHQISSLPIVSCSQNPKPNHKPQTFLRICAEGVAAVLVGSILLAGMKRLNCRPAIALPGVSEEESVDTQKGKDEGDEMYAKILERDPKDVEALKVVLYGKMRKGKTAEAVKFVERLIALEPDEVEWQLLLALSYELMGQLSKAKRLFKEILEERPLLIRALHGLALAMHKNREGPAVFEMLNKALQLAIRENRVIEERNIRILIAQMLVVKGDLDGASRQFQDLVSDDPRDFRPYLCQGIIYSLLDKQNEANEQFEIYRSLAPDEFPQRGFIDDVVLSAKTETRDQLQKEFDSEFSDKK